MRRLLLVYGTVLTMTKNYIAEHNLPVTVEQLHVLMCVYEQESVSVQEIADILGRDKFAVRRAVASLKANGLIEVKEDNGNKRRTLLSLTDIGREVSGRFV